MAGFATTHDQQQIRRFVQLLPLRALIYGAALGGWLAGPGVRLESAGGWLGFAVQTMGLVYLALMEFALALLSEGTWNGPAWAAGHARRRRWLVPGILALLAALSAFTLHWCLVVANPEGLLGVLAAVALLIFGTMRHTLRQPIEQGPMPASLAKGQIRLMAGLAARGESVSSDSDLRAGVLGVLLDQPDNTAARLLAWQLSLKAGDLSDAAHQVEQLRRLALPDRDLSELEALLALATENHGEAIQALDRRTALIRENPRTSPAGQRADFVAILLHSHALVRGAAWDRAARSLDALAADYETAPFVGQLDRLIVNHLRWQTARALAAEQTAREIERRCRRFARRSVRASAKRLIGRAESDETPESIRWWPSAARAALEWWEGRRRRG
jgi:hypothetical protein